MEHLGQRLRDVEVTVATKLNPLKDEFTEDGHCLPDDVDQHTQTLLDVVNKVTSVNSGTWIGATAPPHVMPSELNDFNVMYDRHTDELFLYMNGAWISRGTMLDGVCELMEIIRNKYWNKYEVYLIRRKCAYCDQATLPPEQEKATELLRRYYNFLHAFQLRPYAEQCEEENLSNNKGYEFAPPRDPYCRRGPTQLMCIDMYNQVEDDFDHDERKDIRQKVCSLIRENTKASIELLHKCICELYYFDTEFASKVLALRQHG
jgi:hypothetical protein